MDREVNWKKAEEFAAGMGSLSRGGFNPYGPWAQAIQESKWFNRVIGEWNFWGIKAPKWWHGKKVEVLTHEWVNSKLDICFANNCPRFGKEEHQHKIKRKELFVDFNNIGHAMRFYANRIARLYPAAWKNRGVVNLFFDGLQSGRWKWATDPVYADSLKRLYMQVYNDKEHKEVLEPRFREYIMAIHGELMEGKA
mgnify:CR=1 FL=1